MKTIIGLKNIKPEINGSIATIGVFDGVHAGHKGIIGKVVSSARKAKLKSVVVTFDPHPVKILSPRHKILSLISLNHRIRLIEELGVDILVIVKFTRAFSGLKAEEFVKDILAGKLRIRRLFVGGNFYFGNSASAGPEELERLSKIFKFKAVVIKPLKAGKHIISSSLIRKLILRGKLREAAALLGRPVSVFGTVVKGSGIARKLGCPTANVNPHHEVIPPRGVYAVRARLGRKMLRGIVNIGFRPTFYSSRDEEPTVEAHFFGFKGNIYNKDIEVYFVNKIRDERKFRSKAALINQIRADVTLARKMLYK